MKQEIKQALENISDLEKRIKELIGNCEDCEELEISENIYFFIYYNRKIYNPKQAGCEYKK